MDHGTAVIFEGTPLEFEVDLVEPGKDGWQAIRLGEGGPVVVGHMVYRTIDIPIPTVEEIEAKLAARAEHPKGKCHKSFKDFIVDTTPAHKDRIKDGRSITDRIEFEADN